MSGPALAQAPGREWLGVLNAVIPRGDFRLLEDLPYGTHPRQRLDVYLPEPRRPAAPIAVFAHGGGFREGTKAETLFVGQALAELGFVTVVPDYRLFPEVRGPALVEDLARAAAWAQSRALELGADPGRLVLAGHSAGAYAVALLAADPARLRAAGADPAGLGAAVCLSGAYTSLGALDPELVEPLRDAAGAILEPLALVGETGPPFLILHGSRDALLPVEGARAMVRRLRETNRRVLYYELPEESHNRPLTTLGLPLRGLGGSWDSLRDGLARLGLIPPVPMNGG